MNASGFCEITGSVNLTVGGLSSNGVDGRIRVTFISTPA
jgi:hypothetical protein